MKSGITIHALVISVLIGLLATSLILAAHLYRTYALKSFKQLELLNEIEQSIVTLNSESFDNQNKTQTSLSNNSNKLDISKRVWGCYWLLNINASGGAEKLKRNTIVGTNLTEKLAYNFFIPKLENGIKLVGKSSLKGKIAIPKKQLRKGIIDTIRFEGGPLHEGSIYASVNPDMPISFNRIAQKNINYLNQEFTETDSVGNIRDLLTTDSIYNSFNNKTLVYYTTKPTILFDKKIYNNIIIVGKNRITIDSSVHISNAIVIAKEIFITSGFHGKVQLIATNNLVIGDSVNLAFPSSICQFTDERYLDLGQSISIGTNFKLQGNIIQTSSTTNSIAGNLDIRSSCKLTGFVYTQGSFHIQGNVHGYFYGKRPLVIYGGTMYANHLLHFNASPFDTPELYSGPIYDQLASHTLKPALWF